MGTKTVAEPIISLPTVPPIPSASQVEIIPEAPSAETVPDAIPEAPLAQPARHLGWHIYLIPVALVLMGVIAAVAYLKFSGRGFGSGGGAVLKSYTLVIPEEVKGPGAPTQKVSRAGLKALELNLAHGLLGGVGVGSHISHIKAGHAGLTFIRKKSQIYQTEYGILFGLRQDRIASITVYLHAIKRDQLKFLPYKGKIAPALSNRTLREEAKKVLGAPSEESQFYIAYDTQRGDQIRLEFAGDGSLESIVIDETEKRRQLVDDRKNSPVRYPEVLEPYQLPDAKSLANFDLQERVCLGLPLGVSVAALKDMPESVAKSLQGGRASYSPTGLILWFENDRITQMAVFLRPGYSQSDLDPYRGAISYGINRRTSIDGLRKILGPENGYSEDYRLRILHYILEEHYFQFGFTPDGEKLVFAGMGLIPKENTDLRPVPSQLTVRTLRDQSVLWRGHQVLAFAEVGALFSVLCETQKHFGVRCAIGEKETFAWLSKAVAKDTSSANVWVEMRNRVKYGESYGEGRVTDAAVLTTGGHFIAAGILKKTDVRGKIDSRHVQNLYRLDRSAFVQSFKGTQISQIIPLGERGQYLLLEDSDKALGFTIRAFNELKPLKKFSFKHGKGDRSVALRLSDNGNVLAAAWRDSVELFDISSRVSMARLQSPQPILDLVTSTDGSQIWTLHRSQITHWSIQQGKHRTFELPERRYLYKIPGSPIVLAMSPSRANLLPPVTALEIPSGKELWRSEEFFLVPPRLGQADEAGINLVAPSLKLSLGIAVIDLTSGEVIRHLKLVSPETQLLTLRDVRCMKLSPDGNLVLVYFQTGLLMSFDTNTGNKVKIYEGFESETVLLSTTPGGEMFVVADDEVHLYERRKARPIRTFAPKPKDITAVELSRDRRMLAVGTAEGQIHLWNARNGGLQHVFRDETPLPPIRKIRFGLGSSLFGFISKNHHELIVYETVAPFLRYNFSHQDNITDFEFSQDGRKAFSICAGSPTRLHHWNLVTKQKIRGISIFKESRNVQVAFGEGDNLGVFMMNWRMFEWDMYKKNGGIRIVILKDDFRPGPALLTVDGRHLFRFESKGTRIWDVPTRRAIGFVDNVHVDTKCVPCADGRTLIRASDGIATALQIVRSDDLEEE